MPHIDKNSYYGIPHADISLTSPSPKTDYSDYAEVKCDDLKTQTWKNVEKANEIIEKIEQAKQNVDTSKVFPGIHDGVNHPSHYTQNGIECIEAIKASMSLQEFKGMLKGNAIKYLWRYEHKGKPAEDLKKAIWYIERLIQEIESE